MSRYPGAVWRPTGDEGPMAYGPDACSFHEAVTRAEQSVYGWTVSAHACQAYNGKNGYMEQYTDFDRRVNGVKDGNSHVITVESYDGLQIVNDPNYREVGIGGVYGDSANTGQWDEGQCERFADLAAFLNVEYGIPIITSARAGAPGFGPHRLGVEPWRSNVYGGGESWTAHDGKPCPGDLRVAQIPLIVARAQVIADAVRAGRCTWLPVGEVDLTAALARTSSNPPGTTDPQEGDDMFTEDDRKLLQQLQHDIGTTRSELERLTGEKTIGGAIASIHRRVIEILKQVRRNGGLNPVTGEPNKK